TKAGNPELGRGLLEQALSLADQLGTTFQVAFAKACLAASRVALGERDAACALAQEALRAADRLARAVASRALAEARSMETASRPPDATTACGAPSRPCGGRGFHRGLARP